MRTLTAYELNLLNYANIDVSIVQDSDFAARLQQEEPIEYLINTALFLNRLFYVDKNVLIPRVETEALINIAKDWVLSQKKLNRKIIFADVGTGSGIIGITFALFLHSLQKESKGYLIDISEASLKVAQQNIAMHLLKYKKIQKGKDLVFLKNNSELILRKDMLLSETSDFLKFDIIFANLPYIPSSRIKTLQTSVKNFEPHVALDGGKDGASLIKLLLMQAKNHLRKNGIIILEVDDTHNNHFIKTQVNDLLTYWDINVEKDERGKSRYWICKRVW